MMVIIVGFMYYVWYLDFGCGTYTIFSGLQRHEERVIIISSKDSDNIFSDAENALHQIVSLILKVAWSTGLSPIEISD